MSSEFRVSLTKDLVILRNYVSLADWRPLGNGYGPLVTDFCLRLPVTVKGSRLSDLYPFQGEELFLQTDPKGKAADGTVLPDHPVARDDDR